MAYKSSLLLVFPILLVAALVGAVFYDYLAITSALLVFVVAIFVYLLPVAIILGFFQKPEIKELTRGPFTYYYQAYQGHYWEIPKKFHGLFSASELNFMRENANFLSWYWDAPQYLKDPSKSRSVVGFAIRQESEKLVRIVEKAGLKRMALPEWKAVESYLRVIFDISYAIAPMVLIDPVWKYVLKKYPERYGYNAMYEYCLDDYTAYGEVVSDNQSFFNDLKPYPDPELTEEGKREFDKLKKD
eukprot:TRINITY_DN5183_c0_g1_i3.p1 TRINITY_DN5183_c0_g1~~TRINITY_DN5183_c0_g1_i3.p1  ORF type:complete len:244 (-),score=70.84 TRINITY_DN5183_c0_g1_i3:155-886(-)